MPSETLKKIEIKEASSLSPCLNYLTVARKKEQPEHFETKDNLMKMRHSRGSSVFSSFKKPPGNLNIETEPTSESPRRFNARI